MLIKTDKQKDNVAKFFYDIAKIDFAGLVITQITSTAGHKLWVLILGISATILPFTMAYILDGREVVK